MAVRRFESLFLTVDVVWFYENGEAEETGRYRVDMLQWCFCTSESITGLQCRCARARVYASTRHFYANRLDVNHTLSIERYKQNSSVVEAPPASVGWVHHQQIEIRLGSSSLEEWTHREAMDDTVDPFLSRSSRPEKEHDVVSCYLMAWQCKSIGVEDRFASRDSTTVLKTKMMVFMSLSISTGDYYIHLRLFSPRRQRSFI